MTARPAALAALALVLPVPPAFGATASLEYEPPVPGIEPDAAYSLTVRDRSGEPNRLSVASDASGFRVRDIGHPLTPGEGCETVASDEVRCATPRSARQQSVFVQAGDGRDIVGIGTLETAAKVELDGGRHADLLAGGVNRDLLRGGPGDDWIGGGSGDDRLDGGTGDDTLDGGDGIDTVSYERRAARVTADLASGRGGTEGERDRLSTVENLTGGRGGDRLRGDDGPNTLLGGQGDTVVGRGGDDLLYGHRVAGGGGDDRIRARRFSCGPGNDFVVRTLRRLRGPFPSGCDAVLLGAVFVRPGPVSTGRRRLVLEGTCLYDLVPCAGRIEVRDGRGRVGSARFRLPPGGALSFRRIVVRLDRAPAARVVEVHADGKRPTERDWFRMRLR